MFFVQIGCLATPAIISELASQPTTSNVVQLDSYDALPGSAPLVLSRILQVSLWVRRAKCIVPLLPNRLEVVQDLDAIAGLELMCPGWEHQENDGSWLWNPHPSSTLVYPQTIPWTPDCSKPSPTQSTCLEECPEPLETLAECPSELINYTVPVVSTPPEPSVERTELKVGKESPSELISH